MVAKLSLDVISSNWFSVIWFHNSLCNSHRPFKALSAFKAFLTICELISGIAHRECFNTSGFIKQISPTFSALRTGGGGERGDNPACAVSKCACTQLHLREWWAHTPAAHANEAHEHVVANGDASVYSCLPFPWPSSKRIKAQ